MNTYERIFGAGPRGALISIILLGLAYYLEAVVGLPQLFNDDEVRFTVSVVFFLAGTTLVGWSLYSLPPKDRGRHLVITGAFKYARHPLYAAFLLFFNVGLSLLLNNWIYLMWAFLLLPIWSVNVVREEKLMARHFGQAYESYCKKTGRFFPKW